MISVLVPIYNGFEFINDSVTSIINQTYTDWELIIGINGHPENSKIYNDTINYINSLTTQASTTQTLKEKIHILDLFTINNKSDALNEMIKHTRDDYKWIALLDVDDIWRPNKLEIQSKYMEDYDVIGTQCIYFGERLNGIIPRIPLNNITEFNFKLTNPIINSSVLIRKEYCYWDKKWIVEDYDLWIRLQKQNKRFFNCKEILVKHRIHNQSAFNSKGNSLSVEDLLKFHYKS